MVFYNYVMELKLQLSPLKSHCEVLLESCSLQIVGYLATWVSPVQTALLPGSTRF